MDMREATSILDRMPQVLDSLLAGLPKEWGHRVGASGVWSAYDIVGHLCLGEAYCWMPWIRMILEHGTTPEFELFDRTARWRRAPDMPIEAGLDTFRKLRRRSLDELSSLDIGVGDLDLRGVHPELGDFTVAQLLATWVAHDLTHLAQIGEVMARNYRDDVGPWRACPLDLAPDNASSDPLPLAAD
jgi:hypothetical protein